MNFYITEKELNKIDCHLFLKFVYLDYYSTHRGYKCKVVFKKYITPQILLDNFFNRYLYILYLMYLNKSSKEISLLLGVSTSRFYQIKLNIYKILNHPKFQSLLNVRIYDIENNQRIW